MISKKYKIVLACVALCFVPACMQQSDDSVIQSAHDKYQIMSDKYHSLLHAVDDQEIIMQAQRYGQNHKIHAWSLSGLWHSACGDDYLVGIEGAPLHRTVYFIKNDIALLSNQLNLMAGRSLNGLALYQKIHDLKAEMAYILTAITSNERFVKEDRYIENRRLENRRLDEERKQRELLQEIVRKKPVVVVEEVKTCEPPVCVKQKIKKKPVEREIGSIHVH